MGIKGFIYGYKGKGSYTDVYDQWWVNWYIYLRGVIEYLIGVGFFERLILYLLPDRWKGYRDFCNRAQQKEKVSSTKSKKDGSAKKLKVKY